jgi:Ca2+-transporting ATPase
LIAAAIITFLIGYIIDTIVILAVVIINTTIGFFQEYKADRSMQALKNLSAPKAIVTRNSVREKIDVAEVVPGDIIELIAGNKVPADVRIFETRELDVDESMLTGESIPVRKSIDPLNMENVAIGDQINMLLWAPQLQTEEAGRLQSKPERIQSWLLFQRK